MFKSEKAKLIIVIAIGVVILMNLAREKFFGKRKSEINIAGHRISTRGCLGAVNEVFGPAVDSVKLCDCMLAQYYEIIKDDPEKAEKFEYGGIIVFEGKEQDRIYSLLRSCTISNILDTNYKLNIGRYGEFWAKRFRDSFKINPSFNKINPDSFSNCVLRTLDGRITIKEYFSESYYNTDSFKKVLNDCIQQSIRKD